MTKTQLPTNFIKHTSNNPLQRLLITNFYNTLFSLVKPLSPNIILDAGCGEGFTLNELAQRSIGNNLEGIDNTKEAIELAKKQFPQMRFMLGDIYNLPYKNNMFDLVICTEVLEHLQYPKKGLKEVLRVSKKYALFSVPNEPFFMTSNLLRGKNITRWGNDPGHLNHWNPFSLKRFLKQEHVAIITVKLPFPWTMVLVEKKGD